MRLGVIGLGQMGRAIVQGLIRSSALAADHIAASGRDQEKLQENCKSLGIQAAKDSETLVRQSDWILLAIKPYQADSLLKQLREDLKGKVLLSVLAGKNEDDLKANLDESTEVVCALPNTPVAVSKGIWILSPSKSLTPEHRIQFFNLFGKIGHVEELEGAAAGAAGSIAGCGPAFAAMFIEALGDAGVRFGLPRDRAYRISAAMVAGLAQLELESGTHPAALKDQVCSPGGTTIRGVLTLEEKGFRAAVEAAIRAVQE